MNIRLSLAQTNIVFLFTFSLGFKVLELLIFLLSFLSGFDNGSKNYKAKINWFEREFYKSATYCFLKEDWSHTDVDIIFLLTLITLLLQNAASIINVILHKLFHF